MTRTKKLSAALLCAVLLAAGAPGWAQDEDFYFWRWGHMDGPHDSSKALGISRDGKVAVGSTLVVDFERAWRSDIDWAIATDDGVPPLYNELQVQEDVGVVAPSQFSAAFAASDMTELTEAGCDYDKEEMVLDWCGSKPVGTLDIGSVSYGIQWLLPVLDSVDEGDYVAIPDFGAGVSDMRAMDISVDGKIMVGYGHNKRGQIAFYADMTDPLLPVVVKLPIKDAIILQTLRTSSAQAVAVDDYGYTILAGYGSTKKGNRAFVTTVVDATTDPFILETRILPMLGGGKFAEAYAMTPDGAIIAGRSDAPKGPVACIWFIDDDTGEWVVKELGSLSKRSKDSVATGIAYRPGSVVGELIVVGSSKSILYQSEAFVWTGNPVLEDDEVGYFHDLEYILTKTGVGELSGMGSEWILNEATGISAAGDRIVGWGVNPEGGVEAWVVTGFPYDELVFTHDLERSSSMKTTLAALLPLSVAGMLATAPDPALAGRAYQKVKGEVIKVERQLQTPSGDAYDCLTVRTRQGEQLRLHLGEGGACEGCFQVGDQVRARVQERVQERVQTRAQERVQTGEGSQMEYQVRSMKLRREGHMLAFREQGGQLVRVQGRVGAGPQAGRQGGSEKAGGPGSGSGKGRAGGGGSGGP